MLSSHEIKLESHGKIETMRNYILMTAATSKQTRLLNTNARFKAILS